MTKKRIIRQGDSKYEGLSGAQIGQKKIGEIELWVSEVDHAGTQDNWRGRLAGTVSREKIAVEGLGWPNKNPFHQNDRLRAAVDRVEKRWFGGAAAQGVESVNAALGRSQKQVQRTSADTNRLASKVADLEAEVRTLRRIVRSYEEQRQLVTMGLPGFGLPE